MRPIVSAILLLAACGNPASKPAAVHPPLAGVATSPPGPPPPPVVRPVSTLPLGGGDFGTPHPMLMRRADPGERWMALCQARSDTDGDGKIEISVGHHGAVYGDAMALYLVLGGGAGTPIDALASQSADGRWLAIVRGPKVELVDAQTGEVFALRGADALGDGRPGSPHRAAQFAGNRLLYIRTGGAGGDRLVVHDPADHTEREVATPGRLWRIEGGGDRLVRVYTVPQGQPFPTLHTSLDAGECIGPPMSYSTGGQHGPQPTPHWLDLDTGKELAADGGEVAVGEVLVRTPADGALYFDGEQIAPPACRVQLLAVMPAPVRAIAICGEKKQAKIVLLGKGLRRELAAIDRDTQHYGGLDRALDPADGVVCDGGLHCIATATNQVVDLKGGVVEYAWGGTLYVVHATTSSRKHEIIDVVGGRRAPIAGKDSKLTAGKFIVDYDDNLIDLEAGTLLGKVTGATRVSTAGRVLRPVGKRDAPVRWSTP